MNMREKKEIEELRKKLVSGCFVNEDGSEITSPMDKLKIGSNSEFDEEVISDFLNNFQSGNRKEYRIMVPNSYVESPYNAYLYEIGRAHV